MKKFVLFLMGLFLAQRLVAGESDNTTSSAKASLWESAKDPYISGEKSSPLMLSKPAGSSESYWKIRSGLAVRKIGRTSVSPDYSASVRDIDFFNPNPSVGPVDSYSDRTYDDGGVVNIGAATSSTGLTTNFDYNASSRSSDNTLLYSASGGVALDAPTGGRDSSDPEASPFIEIVYFRPIRKNAEIGLVGGFSFSEIDSSIRSNFTEYDLTTEDTYLVPGDSTLPLAPFNGSFSGPNVLINNLPTSRRDVPSEVGTRSYSFESDIDLFSISLGTEISWHASPQFLVNFGGGLVINYADVKAETSIALINETEKASMDDSEFLFGVYAKFGATYRLNEQLSLEGFFRYDFNESFTGNVGNTGFEVDLDGYTAGIGVGIRF